MQEDLLQFIWQRQLFKQDLISENGQSVRIIHPGNLNRLAGPDFSNAKIELDGIIWVGNIEIHVRESDWFQHGHQHDKAYDNIILHVVYDKNFSQSKTGHTTVNLYDLVDKNLLERYKNLMNSLETLHCSNHIRTMDKLRLGLWFSAIGIERFQAKLINCRAKYHSEKSDLDYLLMHMLFLAFGFGVNTEAFNQLSMALHPNIFYRLNESPEKINLLLKGMASFDLNSKEKSDFNVLIKRFKLVPICNQFWNRGALRPANKPQKRLEQLSSLMQRFKILREAIHNKASYVEIRKFIKGIGSQKSSIGQASMNSLIINAVVPYLFLLSENMSDQSLKEHALEMLESINAEENRYTRIYTRNGLKATNSLESQAMIHLYQNYCRPKKCLNCAIENDLILSHDRKN